MCLRLKKGNGKYTLAENVADNGGVEVAYLAYRQWVKDAKWIEDYLPGLERFSAQQMFWLNYAQIWCSSIDKSSKIDLN